MFYGRFSRETGRWIVECPPPSALVSVAKIEPKEKVEEIYGLPSGMRTAGQPEVAQSPEKVAVPAT